jgi:hypothetical protein
VHARVDHATFADEGDTVDTQTYVARSVSRERALRVRVARTSELPLYANDFGRMARLP